MTSPIRSVGTVYWKKASNYENNYIHFIITTISLNVLITTLKCLKILISIWSLHYLVIVRSQILIKLLINHVIQITSWLAIQMTIQSFIPDSMKSSIWMNKIIIGIKYHFQNMFAQINYKGYIFVLLGSISNHGFNGR